MKDMSTRRSAGWQRTKRAVVIAGALVLGVCGGLPVFAVAADLGTMPATASQTATPTDLPACLLGEWRHSHEADTAALRVYRPADYPFPPSRGRTGFGFIADGRLIAYEIAPADGILELPGRWTFTPPDRVTIALDNAEIAPETMTVASCDGDRLTIALS